MDYFHLGIPPVLSSLYAQEVLPTLRATRVLIGIWCLISSVEWVRNLDLFREDGLLSWRILSLRQGLIYRSDRVRWLFGQRSIACVLGVRIVAAIAVILLTSTFLQCVALLVIITSSWFIEERSWLGGDGSDQMGQIASIGALLMAAGLAFNQLALSFSGTLLIGGQLIISYFFAGVSKLFSPEWRHGRALVGAMGTHSYGHSHAAYLFSRSFIVSAGLCWLVIIGETLFPLAIFAPHEVFLCILAAFFLFHLSHAYFMGLNTFVLAFAAAYPSVIVLNNLTILYLRSM
jgi:hypothetical protein